MSAHCWHAAVATGKSRACRLRYQLLNEPVVMYRREDAAVRSRWKTVKATGTCFACRTVFEGNLLRCGGQPVFV